MYPFIYKQRFIFSFVSITTMILRINNEIFTTQKYKQLLGSILGDKEKYLREARNSIKKDYLLTNR
jgi:hypothetical protein